MRLGKKVLYALLLVSYLHRNGQSKIQSVADSLKLSAHFLEQVARQLRIAGLIASVRGPGGGYKVNGTPTLAQVFGAMHVEGFIDNSEVVQLESSGPEGKAILSIVGLLDALVSQASTLTVHQITSAGEQPKPAAPV